MKVFRHCPGDRA